MSWAISTLDDACDLVTDGTHYTPPDIGLGVPFLTVKDVSKCGLDFEGCARISKDEYVRAMDGNSAPQRGDVLFSKDGTVGKVHVVNEEDKFAVLSSLAILRPNQNTDACYLGHVLRSPLTLRQATKSKTGSALRRIILGDLKRLEIPLPPLNEQKRIAAILDKADAICRKRQQAIDLADEFLRSVFLDMFGDPVTNPKGWKKAKLGELCDVGSSKRVYVNEFVETGIPFYRGTEIGQLGAGQAIEPHLFIASKHYQKLKEHSGIPKIGDLLLPSICHDGRIWRVDTDEPFYFKDGRVLWVKVDQSEFNSHYLRSQLAWVFIANYSNIASGTTFAELKIVNLKELSVIQPPFSLQERYSKLVEKTNAFFRREKQSIREGNKLFGSLSQRAFAGEL